MRSSHTVRSAAGRVSPPLLLGIAALCVVVGAAAWYGTSRIRQLEQKVESLDEQLADAEDRVREARDAAEQAGAAAEEADSRARSAEQRARQEEADRAAAEQARSISEAQARAARGQAAQATQDAEAARAEAQRIREEREREISRLQEALGAIADTQRTALGLVMNLGEDAINFDTDKADLKPEDRELLSRIAGVLLTTRDYRIQVFGHTDDVASEEYNQALSERRARAVADYLVQAGIDPAIMTVKGFGETKPLVEGTSPEARARNRRVELGIIDTSVQFTRPVTEDDQ